MNVNKEMSKKAGIKLLDFLKNSSKDTQEGNKDHLWRARNVVYNWMKNPDMKTLPGHLRGALEILNEKDQNLTQEIDNLQLRVSELDLKRDPSDEYFVNRFEEEMKIQQSYQKEINAYQALLEEINSYFPPEK